MIKMLFKIIIVIIITIIIIFYHFCARYLWLHTCNKLCL